MLRYHPFHHSLPQTSGTVARHWILHDFRAILVSDQAGGGCWWRRWRQSFAGSSSVASSSRDQRPAVDLIGRWAADTISCLSADYTCGVWRPACPAGTYAMLLFFFFLKHPRPLAECWEKSRCNPAVNLELRRSKVKQEGKKFTVVFFTKQKMKAVCWAWNITESSTFRRIRFESVCVHKVVSPGRSLTLHSREHFL